MKKVKNTRLFVMGLVVGVLLTIGTTVFATSIISSATFNANRVLFNGVELELDMPLISVVLEGETAFRNYMPVRAVLEGMGYVVDWDGANNAVIVTSPQGTEPAAHTSSDGLVSIMDISISLNLFEKGISIGAADGNDWTQIGVFSDLSHENLVFALSATIYEGRSFVNEADFLQGLREAGIIN